MQQEQTHSEQKRTGPKQPDKKQRFHGMAAIGMGLGLLFGILWENLPLGLLMGAALAGFGNMTTKR